MMQGLFEDIIYDLDTRCIVNFHLKPWADRYLVLRNDLFGNDPSGTDGGNTENDSNRPDIHPMTVFGPEVPVGAPNDT